MANGAHHSREALCTASILWFFWALSALPLLVLITEFGRFDPEACGNMGWYYARLYSHVFLYPITFGLVSTVFLTLPWVQSVDYLRGCLSNDPKRGIKIVALIVVSILLVTGISGSFGYSYSSYSHPALWSFAPDYMDEKGEDTKKLREKIEEQCDQNNRKKFEKTIEKTTENTIEKTTDSIPERITEKTTEKTTEKITEKITKKLFFLQSLRNQWKNAPLSHTEVFYRIGHLAMTILFCLLFTTGFLFAVDRQMEIEAEMKGQGRFYVWVALFFASFWVLMRATFLFEEQWMYKNPLLEVHKAFLILFVGLFVLLPSLRHLNYKNNGKDNNKKNGEHSWKKLFKTDILIIVGLVDGTIMLLELGNDSPQIGKIFVFMFGTRSSISSYISMFIVIIVFALPFILQHMRKESSEVDENKQGWFKRIIRKFPYCGR